MRALQNTDKKKEQEDKFKIDFKTHKIKSINYFSKTTKKSQILLGDSGREDSNHIHYLKYKRFGTSKRWNHFTITREGQIYQHFNPNYYSNYFGNNVIAKKTISVVLENMGYLYYDKDTGKYLNWINEECLPENVYEKKWKSYRFWEPYTNEQMNSVIWLSKFLCDKYSIDRDCLGYNNYEPETIEFNGIVTKSNYDQSCYDVNPSFDFKYFIKELEK